MKFKHSFECYFKQHQLDRTINLRIANLRFAYCKSHSSIFVTAADAQKIKICEFGKSGVHNSGFMTLKCHLCFLFFLFWIVCYVEFHHSAGNISYPHYSLFGLEPVTEDFINWCLHPATIRPFYDSRTSNKLR